MNADKMIGLPKRAPRRTKLISESKDSLVVIGGGIAGVCCAQELSQLYPNEKILLVSATDVLREATSIMKLTNNLEEFSIFERRTDQFCMDNKNIEVIHAKLNGIDSIKKTLHLDNDTRVQYSKVCICTGSQPKTLAHNHNVLCIRDLESVQDMTQRLRTGRKVVVVGNGGIAMELVNELTFCDVVWIIRDSYVGTAFFDAASSAFILPSLLKRCDYNKMKSEGASIDTKDLVNNENLFTSSDPQTSGIEHLNRTQGSALGPEWVGKSAIMANLPENVKSRRGNLSIEFDDEVAFIYDTKNEKWNATFGNTTFSTDDSNNLPFCKYRKNGSDEKISVATEEESLDKKKNPLHIKTKKGKIFDCDFVVNAIGVAPCTDFVKNSTPKFDLSSDNALIVDRCMETSCPDVFAAGDCSLYRDRYSFTDDLSKHWFQMRLWTQARIMGKYAAQCIHDKEFDEKFKSANDIVFDIFAHVTRFFGHKVVLLGRYNAQGLGNHEATVKEIVIDSNGVLNKNGKQSGSFEEQSETNIIKTQPLEIWTRMTPNLEYLKIVIYQGKVVGALLLGDTDLEEVFENLILNGTDVSHLGISLLDPNLDLEDFFD